MKIALTTERLTLIPFELTDMPLLHQTFTDPFVRKYLWDNAVISAEETKEILLTSEQSFESNSFGLWKIIVKDPDSFAGFVGLWFFFAEPQPQLLYGLMEDYTGKGYVSEASKAMIRFAFQYLKFHYLIASCDSPNQKSKNVCERLNMKIVEEKEINGLPITFYRLDK